MHSDVANDIAVVAQNVEHHFTEVARDARSTFLGNVTLGRDIQLSELRSMYSGVRALTTCDWTATHMC